jgi:hypothetical protein
MKPDEIQRFFPTEAALCALFIQEFNEQEGWTCYPETGGFDVLVAHETGRQIGVEAKLRLNAKVAQQILPSHGEELHGKHGPDHRLVIVASITEANAGIARMLELFGIPVWSPRMSYRCKRGARFEYEDVPSFDLKQKLRDDATCATVDRFGYHYHHALFDWNPPERVPLPDLPPLVAAGVPCPVQLTPWKQSALRVLARLRVQGSITAKEIAAEGCSPSNWTQHWLKAGDRRGQWVETPRLPKFDEQHPEHYAAALTAARAAIDVQAAKAEASDA